MTETLIDTDNPRPKTLDRLRQLGVSNHEIIDAFTLLEYEMATNHAGISWGNTNWLGYKAIQYPEDFFLKAELIWDLQPTLVIETGTFYGASALFYATTMDAYGHGKVVTIDINKHSRNYPVHPRIAYLMGKSSLDEGVVAQVKREVEFRTPGNIIVILDSDHAAPHVRKELDTYAEFVSPGSWLVVEDVNLDGRPVIQSKDGPGTTDGPGPWSALEEWLPSHPEFKVEERKASRYLRSMHAYVRRHRI